MSNLAELAKAVATIFPTQTTASGAEVQTHRVETTEDPKRPDELDVVIVQVFPPSNDPERPGRYAMTVRQSADAITCLPAEPMSGPMAQTVAIRLQALLGAAELGPVTCSRDAASKLPAHSFALAKPQQVAELKPKRAKDIPQLEASA